MKTSHTTFENDLRERLLDVVYAQWYLLGVPFSPSRQPVVTEVIDPEALLWCSLEFLPTEGRLREGVRAWLKAYDSQIIRHRVNRVAKTGEPRTRIWRALIDSSCVKEHVPAEPCHGLDSIDEVADFCVAIRESRQPVEATSPLVGTLPHGPSSGLLRARDLLGSDIRHLLLVYLLASPGSSRLKDIERYSKYSYRSISDTAARWEAAGVLEVERGYCRLVDPEPWHALLGNQLRKAVVVEWFELFDALIHLLRAAAKARRKGLAPDSPVIDSYCRTARDVLCSVARGQGRGESSTITYLRKPVPQGISGG